VQIILQLEVMLMGLLTNQLTNSQVCGSTSNLHRKTQTTGHRCKLL